jgi:hypothetical protein
MTTSVVDAYAASVVDAYAARSDPRKPSTSDFSRSDCSDNPFAALSRLEAAMPASLEARVTLRSLSLTLRVPFAARCALPTISRVAAPC